MILEFLSFTNILFFLSLIFVSNFDFAKDSKKNNKMTIHGIVKSENSRLGGIVILIFTILSILPNINDSYFFSNNSIYIISISFVCILGFADDAYGGIHYLFKLFFIFFAALIICISYDNFIFKIVNFEFFNFILNYYLVSLFITLLIIVGFTNAINISDGANGIASGISFIILSVFYLETEILIFFVLSKFILVFFIYNIVRGRLFLGDSGSYFLGFIISSSGLYLYNENLISAGLLATLLSYPSLEILFTVIRRFIYSSNPLRPDNNHFHNLIYETIKNKKNKLLSQNSLTGIIIISIFSLPGLCFYFIIGTSFNIIFWWVFLIQIFT